MPLQDYPSWELKPRRLSQGEIQDPLIVISEFFSYVHLPEARQHLWEFLKAAVTGTYCKELNRRERSNLLYFYEQLEKLVEAVHIIHQQQPDDETNEEDDEEGEEEGDDDKEVDDFDAF